MPVVEDSDRVLCLLEIGDTIETDEGPGRLTGVRFNTAKYNNKWELEPPALVVELDSGQTIHTCLCSIELPHTQKGTTLLHREFDRLWPPRTDGVPEDADMLIPEGDEEPQGIERTAMKRTAQEGYQGWKNYPTWNTALWINNDQGLQEHFYEIRDQIRTENEFPEGALSKDDWEYSLKVLSDSMRYYFEEWYEDLVQDLPGPFNDLLGYILEQVDWREIAGTFLEE